MGGRPEGRRGFVRREGQPLGLTYEAAWAANIGSFTVKVIDALARMDVMVKSG